MYIPNNFKLSDRDKIIEFITRFNFGTLISVSNGKPIATHLPFVVSEEKKNLVLISHFAKANDHWKDIEGLQVLAIFSEPHAYISPRFYDKNESVPTWNYISIHVYGKIEIISGQEQVLNILETMIDNFEPEYQNQWDGLSKDFKEKMIHGIVAFRIWVEEIQGKEKLSQNKNKNECFRIMQNLSNSDSEAERLIGHYMKLNGNV